MADSALTGWWDFAADKSLAATQDIGPTFGITRALATATRIKSDGNMKTGVAADTARFDHDPVTLASLGFLIEETYIQLAADTGDVSDDAVWVPTNMTKGSDSVTDPTGNANTNVRLTAAAGNATLLQTITSAQDTYIYGQYMKRVTGTGDIDITLDNGVTWTTKTLTSEWQRFSGTDAEETNPVFGVRIVTSGDAIDFWGTDVNKDKLFLTSHIPNNAASGTVTRNQDIPTLTDLSFYNQAEGIIYLEATGLADGTTSTGVILQIDDGGATTDRQYLWAQTTTKARWTSAHSGGDAGNLSSNVRYDIGVPRKSAVGYKVNDSEYWVAGLRSGTGDQLVSFPPAMDTLRLGHREGGADSWNGHLSDLRIYNDRNAHSLEDLSNGLINEHAAAVGGLGLAFGKMGMR